MTIVLVPCVMAFNEGESFIPNMAGLAYMAVLYVISMTRYGKRFIRGLYRELRKWNLYGNESNERI